MTTQSTLLFSAFFALIAAGIYAYTGWQLGKRVVPSSDAKLAWVSFTVWWYGLAIVTLLGGLQNLFGAMGLTHLPLFVTTTELNIQVSCVALLGLLYYLVYLYTGNRNLLWLLAIFYFVFYVLMIYYINASSPDGVNVERWNAGVAYEDAPTGTFIILLVLMLLLPPVIGGFAYFMLYFRVTEVTQKYRIFLVSWSIIIWFLSPLIALAGDLSQRDWWQFVSRLIGLAAAVTILMAYLPPRWLRQRYGIVSLSDENREA
ncbi:MAG TPA: hypothetical protein VJM08_01925 [Anaerolineales bacterium]|nr:hypothetical protein [Anaerolineales bacterium]